MVAVALALRLGVYIWTAFWSFSKRYIAEEPTDPFNIPFLTALRFSHLRSRAPAPLRYEVTSASARP